MQPDVDLPEQPVHLIARLWLQGRTDEAAALIAAQDADGASCFSSDAGVADEDIQLALFLAQEFADLQCLGEAAWLLKSLRDASLDQALSASMCIDIASLSVNLDLSQGRPWEAIATLIALVNSLSTRLSSTCEELTGPLQRLIALLEAEQRVSEAAVYRARLDSVRQAQEQRQMSHRTTLGLSKADKPKDAANELHLVDIHYLTHRRRAAASTVMQFYDGGRGTLEFGVAQVAVREAPGPSPRAKDRFVRLEFREEAADAAFLREIRPLSGQDEFISGMKSALTRSARSEVLVFVHGFNVSFRAAAERCAKTAVDLDIDGAAVLYSWPSKASVLSYFVDRNNVLERYADELATILARIATELRPGSLMLIAHSMGNEFLLSALQSLHRRFGPAFHASDIVYASPDVDHDDFVSRVAPLVGMADRMTLYASRRDRALQISELLQSYDRAGNARNPALVPGIDTIDTTFASKGLLGHADFAGSGLDDLRALAWTRLPPQQRALLARSVQERGTLWRMLSPALQELAVDSQAFGAALTLARRMGAGALDFAEAAIAASRSEQQLILARGKRLVEWLPAVLAALRDGGRISSS
jgi:esterase/lipase superfamily enzyme